MTDFPSWASQIQSRTESVLSGLLPSADVAPQRLHTAMRYVILGGGKRVRPLLAHAAGELFGAPSGKVDYAAASVELIHAYSLVHDDLPCMDDDDLRRGKPSCHKQFDEATALLVGDALQSLAFQTLAQPELCKDAQQQMKMIHLLAIASGSRGMAGGQAIDLASVGISLTQQELEFMHIHKTGALIRAAVMLGAYCAETPEASRLQALDRYAKCTGLAFQVVDDILDTQADTATLGKTAGKDAEQNKPTYVTILGLTRAKEFARELHADALDSIAPFGEAGQRLTQLADFITQRSF
ncbi:MAG: polyprenyl synthetase family protein [Methylophilaceae bacterium]|jgi:farnesyl diphosphate synthase|nr:farnesyl diphosphate synthase [Methylophilaceae bacterium]